MQKLGLYWIKMKLLTVMAFATFLSNSNPMMPLHMRMSFSTLLQQIRAEKVLPALDYFFFSA
jgi:hypothetical protein